MEKTRILIVEDEVIIGMELENTLKNLNYSVVAIVNNGKDAIRIARDEVPDLILMDIRIKGDMDGIDTAEFIRFELGIPIIFSSAYLDQDRIERAKITMPFGYVLKPVQERDLKVTIEMALYVSKIDTERRKALDELKENEKQYQDLFYSMLDGYALHEMIYDENGEAVDYRFLKINPAFEKLTGLKAENIIGKTVLEVLPNTEREWIDIYAQVVKTGEPIRFENYAVEFDRYYEVNAYRPSKHQFVSVFKDVTKSKKAEQEISSLNERFSLATRAARLGIWDWDILKDELLWDDGMFTLYGVKREDFPGAYGAWLKCLHPEDIERCHDESEQMRQQGSEYRSEFRIVKPNGEIRYIKAYGETIRDENGIPVRMTGINYDITERKTWEKNLRKSEARLRSVIENADGAIWAVDANYELTESNRVFRENLEQSTGRVIQKGENILEGFADEVKKQWKQYYDRVLTGESFVVTTQTRLTKIPTNIQYRFNPIVSDDGKIIGATVFRIDF